MRHDVQMRMTMAWREHAAAAASADRAAAW